MLLYSASTDWLDIVKQGGPLAALLGFILYGGFKEKPWWVFGWTYRDLLSRHDRLRQEKDAWRDSALAAGNVSLWLSKKEKREVGEIS